MFGTLQPLGSLRPFGTLGGGVIPPPAFVPTTIREALYAILSGSALVTTLVGDRIYPGKLPQDAPYPAITYTVAGSYEPQSLGGHTRNRRHRVRIATWSYSEGEAEAVTDRLRSLLANFRGVVGNRIINNIAIEGEISLPGSATPGTDDYLMQIVLDIEIWHKSL